MSISDPTMTDFFMGVTSQTFELREEGEVERMGILQLTANVHKLDSTGEDEQEETDISTSKKQFTLSQEGIMATVRVYNYSQKPMEQIS